MNVKEQSLFLQLEYVGDQEARALILSVFRSYLARRLGEA